MSFVFLQILTDEIVKEVENSISEFKTHNQDYDEERVKEQVTWLNICLSCAVFMFIRYLITVKKHTRKAIDRMNWCWSGTRGTWGSKSAGMAQTTCRDQVHNQARDVVSFYCLVLSTKQDESPAIYNPNEIFCPDEWFRKEEDYIWRQEATGMQLQAVCCHLTPF